MTYVKKTFHSFSVATAVPKKKVKKNVSRKRSRGPRHNRPPTYSRSSTEELTAKEKFICDLVVEAGLPMCRALAEGGMYPTHQTRFFKRPNIKAYVDAKRAVRLEVHKHRREMVIRELQAIAYSNITDYLSFGPKGMILKNSSRLQQDQKAAVAEIIDSITTKGRITKIKLHDKKGALDSLAKHFGLFRDSEEKPSVFNLYQLIGNNGNSIQSEEEAEKELERLRPVFFAGDGSKSSRL